MSNAAYESWLSQLRKTFTAPKMAEPVVKDTSLYFLDQESRQNGWKDVTLVECRQVAMFVHEFGHTVTCICSSYDPGAEVMVIVADEPGPDRHKMGTAKIKIEDGKILEAHNQAIEEAWLDFT
jgi:hypothetical protein